LSQLVSQFLNDALGKAIFTNPNGWAQIIDEALITTRDAL